MGIQTSSAEFLIYAKREGLELGHTLTLGRQNLFVSSIRLRKILKKYGLWRTDLNYSEFDKLMYKKPYYLDPFLHYLGATKVSSIDISSYEGADILHDLNLPINTSLHNKYDTVIDGGLLEHVFNFPVAIKNCMEMVKVGGHICILTTANNYFGHGFYQFSPELFYRILSKENGFIVKKMIVTTHNIGIGKFFGMDYYPQYYGDWYEVSDPDEIKQRVLLVNNMPTNLMIIAERTHSCSIFSNIPQQSDYTKRWEEVSHGQVINNTSEKNLPTVKKAVYKWLKSKISPSYKLDLWLHVFPIIIRLINSRNYFSWIRMQSLKNLEFFKKIDKK
jgi:hypothetical protein